MGKSKINVLSENVIGKIAAGEIVERPASCVKELIENSLDASSSSIEIKVQSAGQVLIRIADNGEGMSSEDIEIACRRHTTSKIEEIEDLNTLKTLGFRGEALSSIAAVSQMEITSCSNNGGSGTYAHLESGEILKIRPAGRAKGTTIEIRNLFYNVPARKKFLKKESTELSEIANVVGRFIIGNPGVEFRLSHGDRGLLHASKNMSQDERIRLVLGGDFADHMEEISSEDGKYKLSGYMSKPAYTRKDRRGQLFFINGRYVKSKALSDAVYVAYRSMLERGRYPSVVLFLTIDPADVDVNVHPTKLEVKFKEEKVVKDFIRHVITGKFGDIRGRELNMDPIPYTEQVLDSKVSQVAEGSSVNGYHDTSADQNEFGYEYPKGPDINDYFAKKPDDFIEGKTLNYSTKENLFQIGDCYIVQIKTDLITITDQHAAHERILYEVFSEARDGKPVEMQNLLFPVRLDISTAETVIMEKVIEEFKPLGFIVEPFGENSFIVQAVPAILRDRDIKTVMHDILLDLSSSELSKINIADELIKLASCRAAVKAGDGLNSDEMRSLLDKYKRCKLPFTCPHGRPASIDISIDELEKRFHRK